MASIGQIKYRLNAAKRRQKAHASAIKKEDAYIRKLERDLKQAEKSAPAAKKRTSKKRAKAAK